MGREEMKMTAPRVVDNDKDEITVTLDGKEIRGWSYADETERRVKMWAAREFVEGWFDAADRKATIDLGDLRDELIATLEELRDHLGDDMNDSRSKRIAYLTNLKEASGRYVCSIQTPHDAALFFRNPDEFEALLSAISTSEEQTLRNKLDDGLKKVAKAGG